MSRGEVNARRSTVTLHMVSSLHGIIAKKDNSVSWLNSSGDVYEKGVSDGSAEEVVPDIEHVPVLKWPLRLDGIRNERCSAYGSDGAVSRKQRHSLRAVGGITPPPRAFLAVAR